MGLKYSHSNLISSKQKRETEENEEVFDIQPLAVRKTFAASVILCSQEDGSSLELEMHFTAHKYFFHKVRRAVVRL